MNIDTIITCIMMLITTGIIIWASVYIKTIEDIKRVIKAASSKIFNIIVFLTIGVSIYFLG